MESSHSYCTFRVDQLHLGVQVQNVQEVIRHQHMTPVPLAPKLVRGLMNLRGQIVTALDLRERLQLSPRNHDSPPMNVVIRTEEGSVSMLVDAIGDVLQLDPALFEPPPETLQGVPRELIRGAYKLDGQLLLVLDIEATLNMSA